MHRVHRSGPVRALPSAQSLLTDAVASYMAEEHLAGVLVLQKGQIRAERYALGLTSKGRWTSFSVTKAVTDTLVGAALHSGTIRSLNDDVTQYLPELRGSAYQGVTVRQLLTMTSGVRWTESYTSATADNVLLYRRAVPPGQEPVTAYMRTLPRKSPPGTEWNYNTGETDLLGVLLRRATGRTLADQLSATVWKSAGMQADAQWIATADGPQGEEFGGSGISATLRDFGRFGQWVLEGGSGAVNGDWFASATRVQVQAGGTGYGYGWWPQGNGTFAALGIFGQSIFIDPARELVIVSVGDWPEATGSRHTATRAAFWQLVQSTVDRESP